MGYPGFYPGETISVRLIYKDRDGNYVDLTEGYPKVSIFNPNNEQVGDTFVASKVTTGIYEFDWDIPTSGDYLYGTWTIKVESKKGSWKRKKKSYFKVESF